MPLRPQARTGTCFEKRTLTATEAAATLTGHSRGGQCREEFASVSACVNHFVEPLITLFEERLVERGFGSLASQLPAYLAMKMGIGMVRPRRIDDLYNPNELCYNAFLASLLTRKDYYTIHKNVNCDIADLIRQCNRVWGRSWKWGRVACGDETIVPTKSLKAGKFRQFVARKPHNTGLKLYVLSDGRCAYAANVYLYVGRRGVLRRRLADVSGKATAREIVQHWSNNLPPKVALIADSFFGSHTSARDMVAVNRPFLFLARRCHLGVKTAGAECSDGEVASAVVRRQRYSLIVYKQPPVGGKSSRVVPFVSNCLFDAEGVPHKRGYVLPAPVFCYRIMAGGVDTCNQLALQHRELTRFRPWSQALRAFMLRYALVNAYTVCRMQGLFPWKSTMFEWQWGVLKVLRPPQPSKDVSSVHYQKRPNPATARLCQGCRQGRTVYVCGPCDVPLHPHCFGAFHDRVAGQGR